ncbi:MAG: PHP domain-containing protein [Clostridia bacterium]|nr:PHP domain-containing protein [Clostridia bacterium]
MKKYLLPEGGQFYKANLHCHTTVSDGKFSPAEVKDAYKSRGYSIVAYTDHDVMIPHDELNDEGFLALHGYEMEATDTKVSTFKFRKTCHMCLIALDPDNLKQVCWHREKYMVGHGAEHRHLVQFDENMPDFERAHTHECVNIMMNAGRENGFFVTYNHPVWSLENRSDYEGYHGMHAMEICNYGCFKTGFSEYNATIYDDMLRMGKRIYCIGTDDNHNGAPLDSPRSDSFGAFTMIKADNLEYKTITDALVAGNFYASQGPEIKELYFEDGKLYVTAAACEKITLTTGTRKVRSAFREKGKVLTKACFEVLEEDIYVRITVKDKHGKYADTNAYFTDELFK